MIAMALPMEKILIVGENAETNARSAPSVVVDRIARIMVDASMPMSVTRPVTEK